MILPKRLRAYKLQSVQNAMIRCRHVGISVAMKHFNTHFCIALWQRIERYSGILCIM